MYQISNQNADELPFKTYMVKLSMEDFNRLRDEIRRTLMWDRSKWWRCLHGRQQINAAEKLVISQIIGCNPWESEAAK